MRLTVETWKSEENPHLCPLTQTPALPPCWTKCQSSVWLVLSLLFVSLHILFIPGISFSLPLPYLLFIPKDSAPLQSFSLSSHWLDIASIWSYNSPYRFVTKHILQCNVILVTLLECKFLEDRTLLISHWVPGPSTGPGTYSFSIYIWKKEKSSASKSFLWESQKPWLLKSQNGLWIVSTPTYFTGEEIEAQSQS